MTRRNLYTLYIIAGLLLASAMVAHTLRARVMAPQIYARY
ncbi:hypothetical protein GGR92_000019 [Spirosoma lacussanchae]